MVFLPSGSAPTTLVLRSAARRVSKDARWPPYGPSLRHTPAWRGGSSGQGSAAASKVRIRDGRSRGLPISGWSPRPNLPRAEDARHGETFAAFAGSPIRSGGGGSVAQIGRSKVNGYSVTPSRVTGSSRSFKSAQVTSRMLPLGIVLTSHSRAVLSLEAVRTCFPLGLKAAEKTRHVL